MTTERVLTDELVNELRQKHGVTSNGRGIKEWANVLAFAADVEAAVLAKLPEWHERVVMRRGGDTFNAWWSKRRKEYEDASPEKAALAAWSDGVLAGLMTAPHGYYLMSREDFFRAKRALESAPQPAQAAIESAMTPDMSWPETLPQPCPFCACPRVKTHGSGRYISQCMDCRASGAAADSIPQAVENWNRRAALASAPGAVPVAYIQRDHLQKARRAPFLCRVEPTRRWPDMDPIYLDPPAPDPAGGLSDADIAHRWEADFEWDGPLWSAIKQWEEKGGETRVDAVEREVRRLMREAATPVDPAGDPPEREAEDSVRLDWLDQNLRFKMGWSVRVAPAGNIAVQSVIFPTAKLTPIRAAIDEAMRAAGQPEPKP